MQYQLGDKLIFQRKMILKQKKAAITMDRLVPIILGIVIAGMVMGAGSIVLSKFAENIQTTTGGFRVSNETLTVRSIFANTSAASSNASFVSLTNVLVINSTGKEIIGVGNYTIDSTAGTIVLINIAYNNTLLDWTYDYTLNNNPVEYLATKNASQGVLEIASFMPTIGVIVAAIIIIGLVMLVGRKRTM